jgi:hypothetical protein
LRNMGRILVSVHLGPISEESCWTAEKISTLGNG